MSLLTGYFILCIASRRFYSAQIRCMKKSLLRHTHPLMLFLFLYYQQHILQWKKIGQSCQRSHFSFNSLHWGYSLLGNEDRNMTLHTQLTPLSYAPYVEQWRISQLPSHCKSKHYYFYENKCKPFIFLFDSHHLYRQNSHASSELLCLSGDKTGIP